MALTDRQCRQAHQPAVLIDGNGLRLKVSETASGGLSKRWVLRFTLADGRQREAGLGAFPETSLSEAREKAAALRKQAKGGVDPLAERENVKRQKAAESAAALTFREAAERYLAAHEGAWKNAKHRAQWRSTLEAYAHPVIGDIAVGDITEAHVFALLDPIWQDKTETASRLRGRLENILDWCKVRGYRKGENPARWRGHLQKALPARSKVQRVQHHAAMAIDDLPGFMADLRSRTGTGAEALQFLILTASRYSETAGATWGEIDRTKAVWTIPAMRMKAGREHRVALSDAALAVLDRHAEQCDSSDPAGLVFESDMRTGARLSDATLAAVLRRMGRENVTVHGFRSTFRDWAGERTAFAREIAEAALAHRVGDATERAYARGDLLEKRRALMAAWAAFCTSPPAVGDNIVPLRGEA